MTIDARTKVQMRSLERKLLAHSDDTPWTGLLMVDPETGEQENWGAIVDKRLVAKNTVWLTYSKIDRLWWIVWQDDRVSQRLRKWGYGESRRQECWRTFFELTEAQMHGLEREMFTVPVDEKTL